MAILEHLPLQELDAEHAGDPPPHTSHGEYDIV